MAANSRLQHRKEGGGSTSNPGPLQAGRRAHDAPPPRRGACAEGVAGGPLHGGGPATETQRAVRVVRVMGGGAVWFWALHLRSQ